MNKQKADGIGFSAWQQRVIAELRAITVEHPDALEIIGAEPVLTEGRAFLMIRLPTRDLRVEHGGLQLKDEEDFVLEIPSWPFVPPHVNVLHKRFAGHPHVLQGHRLCIYLDPSREWHPQLGMVGFLERLWGWLSDAAAARFDAATALYHAVGGVLHCTQGTPTAVVREAIPDRIVQRAHLLDRTARRRDVTFAETATPEPAVPVLTLGSGLPFGAGLTLSRLLSVMDEPYSYGRNHTGLGPTPARAFLIALATSAIRNADGTQQYFTLAVPHPSGGPAHLLVGRLPVCTSDELRRLARDHGTVIDIDPAGFGEDVPIEWCSVSDERPEVTTRRDDRRPITAFLGKTVHVWGCGGLGSWIAEFLTRAGVAKISLCDPGAVTGGLLVRQDYVEADIGNEKVKALAIRLHAISDVVDVVPITGPLPSDLGEVLVSTDVIIDATVSIAIGQILADVLGGVPRHAVLAQVATDSSTGTLGILTVSAANDTRSPAVIDADAGKIVLADSALETYQSLWREPPKGHELIPTRGCSVPTFHGSAADLAAVAASLVNLLAVHLLSPTSGTHLIALPYADGSAPHHHFIAA